jgi:hypothetical protein
MKLRAKSTAVVAGLLFSLLSASSSMASSAEGNVRMSRIERAQAVSNRAAAARKVETFKSEKTDSWLCAYVSPFFCSLFPSLPNTPAPTQTPVRGRN